MRSLNAITMSARARLIIPGVLALLASAPGADAQNAAPDIAGLWGARLRFGPDVRGTLTLGRDGDGAWWADISGFRASVQSNGLSLAFELPDSLGQFRGRVVGDSVVGQWIQPRTMHSGLAYATPVLLRVVAPNRWRGSVTPFEDASTYFIPVTRRSDGRYGAYLRDIDRNRGRFIPVSRIELNGDSVRLVGGRGSDTGRVLLRGSYDDGVMRIPIMGRSYDFRRAGDSMSAFYPRGRRAARYSYRPPLDVGDGWRVGTVESVGMDRSAIERFVQMLVDASMDSVSTPQIHSLLIARNGTLVVEEYFHGHSREAPHDLRSASKSWVAVLLGAAMQSGVPLALNTPVYATMERAGYELPRQLDPRKRAMTLEHLISMTAGYDCFGEDAPGDEDVMQQQSAQQDWYRYILDVPMVTSPGDSIAYCSIEPHLAGGMLEAVAVEPLPELFQRLVAEPLRLGRYHLLLSPTGKAYGGGGHQFTSRDFLKLAQLMLQEGQWNGRQITSREWARRSVAPLRNLGRTQQYGWLWNSAGYTHNGRPVRGFFAGGNGGQIFMGIPELGLAIAFTGGNYSDPALFTAQRVYVPQWILPAVR